MADDRILTDEFLEKLKEGLTVNPYTDEQLNRAASFMSMPIMAIAGTVGAADDSYPAMRAVTNFLAGGILAEFINAGCISVSAIDRYFNRTVEQMERGELDDDALSAEKIQQRIGGAPVS